MHDLDANIVLDYISLVLYWTSWPRALFYVHIAMMSIFQLLTHDRVLVNPIACTPGNIINYTKFGDIQ